jgi:hypothetical protein
MHRIIFSLVAITVATFGALISSDANACGTPTLTSGTEGLDNGVVFAGDGFGPGDNVWVGLSLNGSQKCIWSTTPNGWGIIDVAERVTSACPCGVPYQAWALDITCGKGSNIVSVTPACF